MLLTHIHLDHAAATGALVRRWPELEVYVHERGARHLIDPSRLLASAERLYGDQMERLWGEIVPVPEENVRPLAGGETCSACGSPTPRATPPTTSATSTRRAAPPSSATSPPSASPASNLVVPPTPPPDIDIETWLDSIGCRILGPSGSPSPTSARSRPASTSRSSASGSRGGAISPASSREADYENRHRALVASAPTTEEAAGGADPVRPAPVPVAGARPLLGQAGRARGDLEIAATCEPCPKRGKR